jgi:sporulation protein YlmC with PRC-barrel domain
MSIHRALALAVGAALAVGTAQAQDPPRVPEGVFRASALKGIAVRNAKNEDLGKMNDLVVNKDGKIVYGVLSYGGLAGVGDKLFAVPPDQLALGKAPGGDGLQFTVNAAKSQLETTPGFNEKDYPLTPSPVFAGGAKPDDTARAGDAKDQLFRLSSLMGLNVKNTAGEGVGEVNDVMVSLKDGKVVYAALQYGSRLGGTAKYFAVPWEAFEVKSLTGDPGKTTFVLDVPKATLESNPGYDRNNWPTAPNTTLFKKK